jgi:hypothetical protein
MDPRDRADALLARARARGAFVVTPENATSPMDSSNTQQIPREMVNEIDRGQDPDTTTVLPASMIAANDHAHHLADEEPTTSLESAGRPRRQQQRPPEARRPPETDPITELSDDGFDSFSGLIPTVTQSSGRSNLSRRLDGI